MDTVIRRTWLALCIGALFAAALFIAPAHVAAQSRALVNALSQVQQLSNSDFSALASWAQNGTPAPFTYNTALDQAKGAILSLGNKDRQAVVLWLQGNGRSALYAQGASDYQIGPLRAPADSSAPTPSPTPSWRQIPLATASLSGATQGQIQIVGGFAAVKIDGTSAIACVSFKNLSPMTARRIVFDFPLYDAGGNLLGTLTLDRNGEFSSNILIATYNSFSDWIGGAIGPRGYLDNCIRRDLPTAALPILQARTAGYSVVRVEYDGGSVWTPSATPSP